ncbi:MAG TPA: sigma-70 family RNA polymerase sigma factor [Candidatus Limnocylindrales bacterium]|nr:sigma-70 family RNA polymerase sigma factor [Candidatus Limnocylindrales bacterium]
MWPDADETKELLRRAESGDPGAVNQLLARHRQSLRRMVELRLDRALSRRVDASDIVQDALLEASRRLEGYLRSPAMPFHLWLRHIARDRIVDAHRRHRVAARRTVDRERPLEGSAFSGHSSVQLVRELQAPGLTPAAAAIRPELQARFAAALEELGEEDREVILLRHFEQLSNQDTAKTLGLSEPAAGMRYLRAVRRLRAHLGEDHSASSGAK